MSNHSSSSHDDEEILLGSSRSSSLDSSDEVYTHHHKRRHFREYDSDSSDATPQVGSPADNDGMDQGKIAGLLIGAVVLLFVVLFAVLARVRRRRSQFAPTPSLVLHLHSRMESPSSDTGRVPEVRLFGKHRGSTTTTASDISARSSATTAAAPRRFSKGSSGGGDNALFTSGCVDQTITSVRIPLNEVVLFEMVGRGGFGEVFRGSYEDEVVAVKRILPERRHDLVYIEALLAEVKLLATLDHPHIVQFIGVAWDSLSDLCVVSEFMDGGDLRSLLHRYERVEHRPKGFDAEKTRIAMQLAHAIAYLHSLTPAMLHRDIKSRNVLLDKRHTAKLADFGVARQRLDSKITAGVGSALWMAPEVMAGAKHDEKADIYSLGIVLSELDTHLSPYSRVREPRDGRKKIPDVTIVQMVSMGKLRVEFSETSDPVSRQMIELGVQCTARAPSARPTAAQVMHRIHLIYRSLM